MGGKGETGRGEQVRSSPCIKLKAGLFIAALLADYSPGSMTGQEHCHHCFHNLSFVEKQKVSLPLLPAPRSSLPTPASKWLCLPLHRTTVSAWSPQGPVHCSHPGAFPRRACPPQEGAAQTGHLLGFVRALTTTVRAGARPGKDPVTPLSTPAHP